MFIKKFGVVREISEDKWPQFKAKGYQEFKVETKKASSAKPEKEFDIQTAKAGELLQHAATLGEPFAEIAAWPATRGADAIRGAILAKQAELAGK